MVSTPAYADITHSIQSVVSVSTLGASSTATRIGTTFSSSGTNVTPSANASDNAIGTLNLAAAGITDGVPALDYDTTYTVKNAGNAKHHARFHHGSTRFWNITTKSFSKSLKLFALVKVLTVTSCLDAR